MLAYPEIPQNSDLVVAGPYDTAASGAGNWGCAGCLPGEYRYFVTIGQKYRIRENGTISRVRIYTYLKTNVTGFYIDVWRKNGSNYDLVGTSENIIDSLVSADYATIDLASPISGVQEGDYYGYHMTFSAGSSSAFFARTSVSGVTTYYATNSTPNSTNYNWTGQSSLAGAVLPIELYMTAPQFAFIGDSIIAGHPGHYSFLEATATTNIASTIENQFGALGSYTYQNMGIGSQTTTNIAARFTNDIINLHPTVVVLEGGVNDIAGGAAKSTFISNWTTMLAAAQASSSVQYILVLKILPWTNGTNTQMQTRDDWNASLVALASSYSKAIVVDASTYVGEFRAGGDAGNLWNIQAIYNADGVHFNQAGHGQVALALGEALNNIGPTISTLSPVDNATGVDMDTNLVITFDRVVIPQAGADNNIVIKKTSDNSTIETIDAESAQVTGSGTATITINSSVTLDPSTSYYVQIGVDAFDDASGNSFVGISNTTTWNFTTVDIENPLVSTLSPADNAVSVDVSANLVITFDEAVTPQAGANNDIIIKKSSDNSTVETIDAQSAQVTGSGTATITINPSITLASATDYYVQIGADAFDDTSGNSFVGISNTTTWNFTTGAGPLDGFLYYKQITVSNANIDAVLTDFPLRVYISADSDMGAVTRDDGYDIRFTAPDQATILPYQRETWSGGNGSAVTANFWVKTTLNADNNTATNDTIYVYYGKSDAIDGQDAADGDNDVWNSNFAGVWHLDETATDEGTVAGLHADSTSNNKDGSQSGNTNTVGKISNAQDFDGINDVIEINSAYNSADITVSWWSNCAISNPTAEGILAIYRQASGDSLWGYHWNLVTSGVYIVYRDASTNTFYKRILDSSITQADWHYYSVAWDETAKTFTLYVDGVVQSGVGTGNPDFPTTLATTRLGYSHENWPGDVNIDEFRISSIVRPVAWTKFEYRNMGVAGNDINFGDQTSTASTDATISAGTLASQTISGTFTGGANIAGSSALTVTVPDADKTNAALALTKGDSGSTIKYVKGSQPSVDGDYTGTYSQGSTTITVVNNDIIWLLVTAADTTTKLYYKITVTVNAPLVTDITTAGVTGFVAPATGGTPQVFGNLTAGSVQYTVTGLTWSPTDNPFHASTAYTATVVLTSAAIYKFPTGNIASPTADVGTVNSIGTTSGGDVSGNHLTFTVLFPATAAKITPTLSVTNSPVTYNASQQTATVSGSVAGTVSNVEYSGSLTVPTNAGTYAITADFAPTDSTNYNSLTGASAGNFVISKATQSTLTFAGRTVTSPATFSALSTTGGSGTGVVSYAVTTAGTAGCSIVGTTLSYTSAGTCGVTATKAADSNYNSASSSEATFTINAALNSAKSITAFSFQGLSPAVTAIINGTNITATFPFGTTITNLVATFTTTGSSVAVGATPQTSGTTANNFTSPITYTVTAENSTTQDYTVTINVIASLVISDVLSVPNSSGAVITWTTNENLSSKADYGLTTSYGDSTAETDTSTRVASHSVSLSGLSACTTYHYRVRSRDAAANEIVDNDNTFTTTGCVGSAPVTATATEQINKATGGTLTLEDGSSHGLTLTVPALFAGSDANFQAHQLDKATVLATTASPAGYSAASNHIYELKSLADNATTISTFSNALTVSISYGASDIVGLDESTLKIYRYDGSSWSQLTGCTGDTSAKTVTCTTTNFSVFGLFGVAVASTSVTSGGAALPEGSWNKPVAPINGFGIMINNGEKQTSSTKVILTLVGGPDTVNMAISDTINFINSWQEPYSLKKSWTLPSGQGLKTVFVKFYTKWGQSSDPVSASIILANVTSANTILNPSLSPGLFTQALQYGSNNKQVVLLQDTLKKLGFFPQSIKSNGNFGPATLKAVQSFQVKYNIAKLGVVGYGQVGPKTRSFLNQLK